MATWWEEETLERTLMLGKIKGRRRRGAREDKMVGWHHRLHGHGFGWTPEDSEGHGSLVCCSCKESDMGSQRVGHDLATEQHQCASAKSHQSCLTLRDPVDHSPPGSPVHGILQARILEWGAISSSRGSSWCRDGTQVSCIAGRFFMILATRKAPWEKVHDISRETLIPSDSCFKISAKKTGPRFHCRAVASQEQSLGTVSCFSSHELGGPDLRGYEVRRVLQVLNLCQSVKNDLTGVFSFSAEISPLFWPSLVEEGGCRGPGSGWVRGGSPPSAPFSEVPSVETGARGDPANSHCFLLPLLKVFKYFLEV